MSDSINQANNTHTFLEYLQQTENSHIEFFVEGIGWLIILKENIEIVSDNWFASTKYLASSVELIDEVVGVIKFSNVYTLNTTFTENKNNTKYNLMFDEINIFANKIVAFF